MTGRPDFSPAMLAVFLRARAARAVFDGATPKTREATMRRANAALRRLAGVSAEAFHQAWMGWLNDAGLRARIWAALGHYPGDHGIRLTDGGQERG